MTQRAWSFKTIEQGDLRYFGNDGYHDDYSAFYRYDSFVANHKQVKKDDIVIITNRENVLGVSIIDKLTSKKINKKRNKCIHLDCDAKKITQRKSKIPEWRCGNGHEFDAPRVLFEPAEEFLADYEMNYNDVKNISMDKLIAETPRYNGQMSIQEVNLPWAEGLLSHVGPIFPVVSENDADCDTPSLDAEDQRKSVERQIKQRRGQKKFRDALLKKNPVCAVTGCALIDILEAAHIDAYRNDSHNHISNGLLLRSDIHTLFDLNLFAINPETKNIHFSDKALSENYDSYEGQGIATNYKLSYSALLKRWDLFVKSSHQKEK